MDAEIDFEETNFESEDQLEIAEEKPSSPTTEYDSALIEKDENPDLTNEEDTVSDLVQEEDVISDLVQEDETSSELINEELEKESRNLPLHKKYHRLIKLLKDLN